MDIEVSNETILLVIKFKIGGSLIFLSHAETLKVFQRACARGGIEIRHSQGFNPRPKLSLPLPRPVGIESDEDLLCLQIDKSTITQDHKSTSDFCASVKSRLSEQLPEGLELLSVSIAEAKQSFRPCSATYVLEVQPQYLNGRLKARIEHLLASETLNLQRRIVARNSKFKGVDVRPFVKSIELDDKGIVVECKISSAGSIRIEEILELLGLDVEKLVVPVRRTNVKWQEV